MTEVTTETDGQEPTPRKLKSKRELKRLVRTQLRVIEGQRAKIIRRDRAIQAQKQLIRNLTNQRDIEGRASLHLVATNRELERRLAARTDELDETRATQDGGLLAKVAELQDQLYQKEQINRNQQTRIDGYHRLLMYAVEQIGDVYVRGSVNESD